VTDEAGRTEDSAAGEAPEKSDDEQLSAAKRLEQQALWVDLQIRKAMDRGDFDDLPGAGKPIPGLDGQHDPDWWAKKLIEREHITGLAPPAIALRTEHAELADRLDRETSEPEVRRILEDFNARVVQARRQLQGGPPVITPTCDVDAEVAAWKSRRDERRAAQRAQLGQLRSRGAEPDRLQRPWWRRVGRRNPDENS
jgi:hypothetical protein